VNVSGSDLVIENLLPPDFLSEALRADALRGLTSTPKVLPPKWFYDERGSALFEEITRLPEYYPTRAEREILLDRAAEIAVASGATTLVELGSGSSEKTRVLLDGLREVGSLERYVPVDVSDSALLEAAEALRAEYPGLGVHAVVADFEHQLDRLPRGGRRLVAFLGGTIGNLVPADRAPFLASLRDTLQPGDTLLLGTDLVKSPTVLVPAYDDAAGVTADFNRNVLYVLNRELKADFEPDSFEHVAVWDPHEEWIEMRLRSRRQQSVHVAALELDVEFAAGEELRTEVSAKFRRERVASELASAGFDLAHWWVDADQRFALSLSVAKS
jgi:L-histidine N-alpha-methyltransferase